MNDLRQILEMVSALFLCKNILMEETATIFNLWGFCPDYKSASDDIMLDMLLKSMEERENGVFDQSGVESEIDAARPRICAAEGEPDTKFLRAATAK